MERNFVLLFLYAGILLILHGRLNNYLNNKMQLLVFKVCNKRYGIDFSRIIEIVPLVNCQPLPQFPEYVSGLFIYRGKVMPAIDLQILFCGKPSQKLLSTRIIIVKIQSCFVSSSDCGLLGLVSEQVTESITCEATELHEPGISSDETMYLGKVFRHGNELIQCVEPEELLSMELKAMLKIAVNDKENEKIL